MRTKTLLIWSALTLGIASSAALAQANGAMSGMDMGGMKSINKPQKPVPAANAMAGMDMSGAGMSGMKTGIADMKTAAVPQLQEKGTYTATGKEDWKKQTGFGHNAGMVGMMNQMMVGGSGMEGMKMPPMKMKFDEQNYTKPEGDAAAGAGDMAGMDMSSGKAPAKPEQKPDSMAGMKMDAPAPASPAPDAPMTPPSPAAPAPTPAPPTAAAPPKIMATIHAPKAGDNTLQVTVTDAEGQPITGAKIATTVTMTSMDMGTTHPAVKEMGNGRYAATVTFGMAGPWRVQVKVMPTGQKPVLKAFDFTAK